MVVSRPFNSNSVIIGFHCMVRVQKIITNGEKKRIWKEEVVTSLKIVSR
jgi:hypothetical protein